VEKKQREKDVPFLLTIPDCKTTGNVGFRIKHFSVTQKAVYTRKRR
jgi:hypothetical protein